MADHDRARRRWLSCDALQPRRSTNPVGCELADFLADIWSRGRDSVVVVSFEPHDARRLCGAKPDGEHRTQRDRHFPEDVARASLADDALDPVDELYRLDATLEQGEERALAALVHGVLARHEADVGRCTGKPLTLGSAEGREDRDSSDLLGRHHEQHSRRLAAGTVPQPLADSPERPEQTRVHTGSARGQRYSPEPVQALFGQRQSHPATTRRRSMAIIARFDYAPFDESDPDDFRPNSRWAMLVDPGGDSGAQVNDITLIIEEIAPGDRIPLHTHPINEVVVIEQYEN